MQREAIEVGAELTSAAPGGVRVERVAAIADEVDDLARRFLADKRCAPCAMAATCAGATSKRRSPSTSCGRRAALVAVFADPSAEHAWLRARGFAVVSSAKWLARRLTHRIYHPRITTAWLQEHWWYTLGDTDLV